MLRFSRIARSCLLASAAAVGAIAAANAAEKVVKSGDIPYVSGGIGVKAQKRLEAREKEFNLKLVFTLAEGNYVADVAVAITDDHGKPLLKDVAKGPFFMAKLPAGTYTVSTAFRNQPQTRKIAVGEALRTEYFRWPSDPKLDFVVKEAGEPRKESRAAAPGEIAVISGGIGVAEQEALAAKESQYNLKLVFTLVEGNYLSDVNVVVKDAKGKQVVEHFADGPFFMARLLSGQYTVAATYEGRTVSRKVKVTGEGLRTEYLRLPANPQTDLAVSRWVTK